MRTMLAAAKLDPTPAMSRAKTNAKIKVDQLTDVCKALSVL